MNENYNCVCESVEPKEPTIHNLVDEALNQLDTLNEHLSFISETMYGTDCGDHQKLEVKCLNDAMILLLGKVRDANEKAYRIKARLS